LLHEERGVIGDAPLPHGLSVKEKERGEDFSDAPHENVKPEGEEAS